PSLAARSLPRHPGPTRRLARPRPGCAQTPTTTVSRGRPPSPQAEDFLDHRFVRPVYGLLSASYMGSGEERRDREEGGAGWRGPCQHKVEMSAFAPSRDVRGCVRQGSAEDAEDDAAARSRFLARSVTFGLARRAASRSCCCAAIQAKTPSRCLCSTTTPGTSRA